MEPERLAALRLARAGYGTPEQILQMPTDLVCDALEYERFRAEYERAYVELNRDQK